MRMEDLMSNFQGDSGEYEMLTRGIELSAQIDGLCLEIGTRLGLSAKTILDGIRAFCPRKTLVCVDPYGSILYEGREGQIARLDYTNEMKATCMGNIWFDIQQSPVSFKYFDLEDTEFFTRFADGVPVYELEKRIEDKYSFVFFDGPHSVAHIIEEMSFFLPRTNIGGVWCFDDVTPDFYDHKVIDEWLIDRGFELVETGVKKALYRKI